MSVQKLAEVLMELRNASISLGANPSEDSVKQLIQKYDILFLGNRFNAIYTSDLCHYLSTQGMVIAQETLNQAIPDLCIAIGMSCESTANASDVKKAKRPLSGYRIILY